VFEPARKCRGVLPARTRKHKVIATLKSMVMVRPTRPWEKMVPIFSLTPFRGSCLFPVYAYHDCTAGKLGATLMVNAGTGALDTDALEKKYGTRCHVIYRPMGGSTF
jgi:hypothetical protein